LLAAGDVLVEDVQGDMPAAVEGEGVGSLLVGEGEEVLEQEDGDNQGDRAGRGAVTDMEEWGESVFVDQGQNVIAKRQYPGARQAAALEWTQMQLRSLVGRYSSTRPEHGSAPGQGGVQIVPCPQTQR